MMYKKKIVLFYIIGILIVLFFSLNIYESKYSKIQLRDIEILDNKKLEYYMEQIDINDSYNYGYLWGIIEEDDNTSMSKEDNNGELIRPSGRGSTVKAENNKICIDKKCFRILAIFEKNGVKYVSLFNSKFKGKIRSFKEGDVLIGTINIDRISNTAVSFSDIEKKEEWKFDFFDVNTTKYKPKDTNETLL